MGLKAYESFPFTCDGNITSFKIAVDWKKLKDEQFPK
jgi:hypothetical protein